MAGPMYDPDWLKNNKVNPDSVYTYWRTPENYKVEQRANLSPMESCVVKSTLATVMGRSLNTPTWHLGSQQSINIFIMFL